MRRSLPQKIAQTIQRDYLAPERLKVGERLPPVRELEQQYQVSRSTILAALELLEHQGFLRRQHGKGCFAAAGASEMALTRTPCFLGYISPSAESELMLRIYEGIEHAAQHYDLHVLVASACHDYEREHHQVERMIEAGCSAIVLSPTCRTPQQLACDYLNREFLDLPIVLVDLAYPTHRRPRVVFDNYHAGFDITTMLLHMGHKRIAIMGFHTQPRDNLFAWRHYAVEERIRGYLDALRLAEIPFREDYIRALQKSSFCAEAERARLNDLLSLPKPPTAIIALEDMAAMELIDMLQERGIRVPEDITVTGFDNLLPARNFWPPFPTTLPDFRRAGELATWLAYSCLQGEKIEPTTYLLPVPIRRRRHTKAEGPLHE